VSAVRNVATVPGLRKYVEAMRDQDTDKAPGFPNTKRRILVVGMLTSVHIARWLQMIRREDAAILLFPVYIHQWDFRLPAPMRYIPLLEVSTTLAPGLWVVRPNDICSTYDILVDAVTCYRRWRHSFLKGVPIAAPGRLRKCIELFQPEVLHSMEIQLAGYLCFETSRRMGRSFPRWILSNWGSDIALFRKLPRHKSRIRNVCNRVDYYLAECARDHKVARDNGYRGPTLPVVPASGGSDIESLARHASIQPSRRRKILVKGYHGWSGRALLALSAIALAHRHLRGFKIEISLSGEFVHNWVARLRSELDLDVEISPYLDNHIEAIDRLAEARAVIGVGISDGISTTLLEAMSVGTLPIQSCTACADEWIEHGKSGLIVSPHDTASIADAVIRAVSDDAFIDRAAEINLRTVKLRWNAILNGARVWEIYDRAATGQ
jgi:glycosyltransferase involved in cell wall biosynthesis